MFVKGIKFVIFIMHASVNMYMCRKVKENYMHMLAYVHIYILFYKMKWKVIYKDTDTHSYLRYESAHPPSCKKGIPYSQFLRLRRICNNDQTLRDVQMKWVKFSQRAFPVNTIKNSLWKASKFTQSEAINKRKNLNNTEFL